MTIKPKIFIISSPSGGGKSTLTGILVKRNNNLARAVTCTTRLPRPGEMNGRDYYFLSDAKFNQYLKKRLFLEWAVVHGYKYGTPQPQLSKLLGQGKDAVLTIDPQGAASIKKKFPGAVGIFLLPPSHKILERRLRRRGGDAEQAIKTRLANAKKEMAAASRYDYIVINKNKRDAVRDMEAIIRAEKLKRNGKRLA